MKNVFLICLLWLLMPWSLADTWPTGSYSLQTDQLRIDVVIGEVSTDAVQATVSWSASDALDLMAGSVADRFKRVEPNLARYTLSETPEEVFELQLTTFGELVFRFQSAVRPELNITGFLKADERVRLSFDDYDIQQARKALPPVSTWTAYLSDDIWPYWRTETAAKFVSSRCNDGQLPDLEALCPELRAGWIRDGLERNYLRMVSRQTYAYGVIFHLTGDTNALSLMNEGVERILARVHDDGRIDTVLESGASVQPLEQQTSQDLAYAQVGLAMAYYLTGDESLLERITQIKQHLFEHYRTADRPMLAWTPATQEQELVAQLDQLNAYMLLLYPLLPESMKSEWRDDIEWLVNSMLDAFHLPEQNRFAGQLDNGDPNRPGERHNDFGHSVKAYWMILLAGERLDRPDWIALAEAGITAITEQAFRFHDRAEQFSTWANQSYSAGASWWEYAELTQASATMALYDEHFIRYLPESYRGWFGQYVDKAYGGVWMGAGGGAKQHLWKNGYHETELALVAAVTTALIQQKSFSLFYSEHQTRFHPYFFDATVETVIPVGLARQRVIFTP